MAVRYEPGDTAGALAKHKDAFFHILSDTRQPEFAQRLDSGDVFLPWLGTQGVGVFDGV